jgi:hypothetical protein
MLAHGDPSRILISGLVELLLAFDWILGIAYPEASCRERLFQKETACAFYELCSQSLLLQMRVLISTSAQADLHSLQSACSKFGRPSCTSV